MSRPLSKILVANRGEIACRIVRTAKAEGYRTVAIYSDADADALHVSAADEAVHVGGSLAAESYLAIDSIVDAARRTGADAVHPGYGFLAENAAFAETCANAGLVFIGPSPDAIRLMGDKAEAKRRMAAAGVPCVPGYDGESQDDVTLKAEAERIGYPLLLKAAAGGGGRGMRRVESASELDAALAGARSEARNAFGSDALLIEKLVEGARHVEIQVIGDTHGHCLHFGERDCSVQRRFQKIIEEAPSPAMTPDLRERMGRAAVTAAQAVGYVNAGTVEFLLDASGHFYFLEMNTRLQVEHPVTELVTGHDLVALQLRVAQGEPLDIAQEDVHLRGHAIEARIYAEDPAQAFAPQIGRVVTWEPPRSPGVRVDHGLRAGASITPYYDPMIAKVIAHGQTRTEARERLLTALEDSTLFGVQTNAEFLQRILRHPQFADGGATTAFLDESDILPIPPDEPDVETLGLAAVVLVESAAQHVPKALRGWRSTGPATMPIHLTAGDDVHALELAMTNAHYDVHLGDKTHRFAVEQFSPDRIRWNRAGHAQSARYAIAGNDIYLQRHGRTFRFTDVTYRPPADVAAAAGGLVKAPMAGQIVRVEVADGDRVQKQQLLVVLEAMKIENQVIAPVDGVISSVNVRVGDQVDANQVLLAVETGE